jgi:PAS domain S-box-containing protein
VTNLVCAVEGQALDGGDADKEELHFMRFAFDHAADAIFWADSDKRLIYVNNAACKHLGYTRDELLQMGVPDISVRHDPAQFAERWEILKSTHHVCYESLHRHKSGDLLPIEISLNLMRHHTKTFTCGIVRDISDRQQAAARLEELNRELVTTARKAGQSEIATSVLHNVGNVLNSVNVAAGMIQERIRMSQVASLAKAVDIMQQHTEGLGHFVTQDERGKHLPQFLVDLSQQMASDEQLILEEVDSLIDNISHIKAIVATQQAYAKNVGGILEPVSLAQLLGDAIHINRSSMQRHSVEITRLFDDLDPILVDKQKLLQIVVNLISNAKYACMESRSSDHLVVVRLRYAGEDRVAIEVQDNGMGIAAENLTRIFAHGFTTRKEGHGFGLHSAALAAKELGGSLMVHSDGLGEGALFTLSLPCKPVQSPS